MCVTFETSEVTKKDLPSDVVVSVNILFNKMMIAMNICFVLPDKKEYNGNIHNCKINDTLKNTNKVGIQPLFRVKW